jgi:hypothetical protein
MDRIQDRATKYFRSAAKWTAAYVTSIGSIRPNIKRANTEPVDNTIYHIDDCHQSLSPPASYYNSNFDFNQRPLNSLRSSDYCDHSIAGSSSSNTSRRHHSNDNLCDNNIVDNNDDYDSGPNFYDITNGIYYYYF